MATDDLGNQQIDFVWGNFPLQPNDSRNLIENPLLGTGDSHEQAAVNWNYYPETGDADGATRNIEGTPSFIWPRLWLCNYNDVLDVNNHVSNVINDLVSYGVPRQYLQDFTFSGGETKWDANGGEPNWDSGCIFYVYLNPYTIYTTTWLDQPVFGWQLEGQVFGSNYAAGYEVPSDTGYPEDYMLAVVSNDPRKDNTWWWWS